MKKIFFLFSTLYINCLSNNKIVYLISPARSSSVAFLRMMQARGDFKIIHEPSQFAYISTPTFNNTDTIKWYSKNALKTHEDVKLKILQESKNSHVFVKEISMAMKNFIKNNKEFIKLPNMYFVFLIRNPHHSIISLYKKLLPNPLIYHDLSVIVGYEACFEIYKEIKNICVNKPIIILSEDLYKDAETTIQKFCKAVDIDF